jgi:RES domain-containing protein
MIYRPEMLDILQSAAASAWNGTVYRHMFGAHSPARTNTEGARWNALGLAAIYASCERETALAERTITSAFQPLPPSVKRTLFTIRGCLKNVIDLTAAELLPRLGITDDVLSSIDHLPCRTIGAAVNWLGHEGLLVPSARRRGGTNLVIFPQDLATSIFEVTGAEVIEPAQ